MTLAALPGKKNRADRRPASPYAKSHPYFRRLLKMENIHSAIVDIVLDRVLFLLQKFRVSFF